jgi:hypothetical protein
VKGGASGTTDVARSAAPFLLFIGALSVLSILNMVLLLFVKNESLEYVIYIMNAIMTPLFLG